MYGGAGGWDELVEVLSVMLVLVVMVVVMVVVMHDDSGGVVAVLSLVKGQFSSACSQDNK